MVRIHSGPPIISKGWLIFHIFRKLISQHIASRNHVNSSSMPTSYEAQELIAKGNSMITHLHLKSSSSAGQPPLVLETPPSVTIFVGPNNAGKSQVLREIAAFCNAGQIHSTSIIVDKLTFADGNAEAAQAELEKLKVPANFGENIPQDHSIIKIGNVRTLIHDTGFILGRSRPNQRPEHFAQYYLKYFTLILDGQSRIGLINPQGRGDLKSPVTQLGQLLTNDVKREALRKVIHDATGLYFAIDVSQGDQLHVRFGSSPPPNERCFDDTTLNYMRSARGVDSVSDGVKAYTGILLELHAGDPRIIIVDEPEAFLHPSLAQKLGREVAKSAAAEGKHVFVATHSPQFLMGAILSGAQVNIVRLTYEGGVGTARLLPSADLTKLMQDPLLRSTGVLSGLFYNYVIVGEADADRAFYQEINERLLDADDPRGIPHTLFLNANNKQTIPRIVEPLRKLGIPTIGVVDIDVVKDGGLEWTRQLSACNVPVSEHQPFGNRRASVLSALSAKNPDFKSAGGMNLLSGANRESADNLFIDLARYGLFVVCCGEVEAWLANLNVSRAKHLWLRTIFEKMGSDPQLPAYVRPTSNDVWDFIGQMRKWLIDPRRRGIPE